MPEASPTGARRLTAVQWAVCVVAVIGFAFDTYELLVLPLIARQALMELGNLKPGTKDFSFWFGLLFYVPAVCGGVFGLLGGYLTDRLGRRRVLTWSILIYACSAFAAGFSTSLGMLLVLRCATFIGVCVEFVAAVAWLAELFDDPHQRERVLGTTQAFSSFGGLLVAIANGAIVKYAAELPAVGTAWLPWLGAISDPHAAWRYTLMSGLVPALPLILIRPWLPESPAWQKKRESGTLRRPRLSELFSPALARTTIVTTIMVAMSFGAAFGALQMIPQIVPRLSEVQAEVQVETAKLPALADAASEQLKVKFDVDKARLKVKIEQAAAANYTKFQEVGGLLGRALLALLVVRIVSRRKLLRMFLVPGLLAMPLIFLAFAVVENNSVLLRINLSWLFLESIPITPLHLALLVAGLLTIGQFSFWGNYLPRVYPVHLRGTGESFAANVGGRMIGTSFAAITPLLVSLTFWPGASPGAKYAYAAAVVALGVFLVGLVASFFLPEPEAGELPQ